MLGQLIGAAVGGFGSVFNAYQQAMKLQEQLRIQEDHTLKARADLDRAAEANQNLNPEAMAQRSRQDVNATLAGAQGAAANAAAGQSATSGDFGNAQGAAATMSQATTAAAAPYAQQLAGINQTQYQGQADKVRQAQSIADSTGQLSNQINYIMKDRNNINPLGSALIAGLSGVLGGTNTGGMLDKLFKTGNSNNQQQDGTQNVGTAESPMYGPTQQARQQMLGPEPPPTNMDFTDTSGFDTLGVQPPAARAIPYAPQTATPPASAVPNGAPGFAPFNMAQSLMRAYGQTGGFLNSLTKGRNTRI